MPAVDTCLSCTIQQLTQWSLISDVQQTYIERPDERLETLPLPPRSWPCSGTRQCVWAGRGRGSGGPRSLGTPRRLWTSCSCARAAWLGYGTAGLLGCPPGSRRAAPQSPWCPWEGLLTQQKKKNTSDDDFGYNIVASQHNDC